MNSAASSNSGQVDRDTAIRLLAERAVLTRAICQELQDSQNEYNGRRSCAALSLLCQWIMVHFKDSVRFEPNCADGLDAMIVPSGFETLVEEIRDGSRVGDSFGVLLTADTPTQRKNDERALQARLQTYFSKHS